MSRKASRGVTIPGDGIPCPRCGRITEIREHRAEITHTKPTFYTRWFRCVNDDCRTTEIMRGEFRVINPRADKPQSFSELIEQIGEDNA